MIAATATTNTTSIIIIIDSNNYKKRMMTLLLSSSFILSLNKIKVTPKCLCECVIKWVPTLPYKLPYNYNVSLLIPLPALFKFFPLSFIKLFSIISCCPPSKTYLAILNPLCDSLMLRLNDSLQRTLGVVGFHTRVKEKLTFMHKILFLCLNVHSSQV